jgi:alkaline phosphatase
VLLTGVIENSVPARSVYSPALYAHTAVDVPVAAYGPGAAALAGARDNTDVFPAILRAVGGSSGTPR